MCVNIRERENGRNISYDQLTKITMVIIDENSNVKGNGTRMTLINKTI